MNRRRQSRVTAFAVVLSMLIGCTLQAPYMRGWDLAEGIDNRWSGGTFDEKKLSNDEAAVYKELGTPEAVRFFRRANSCHVFLFCFRFSQAVFLIFFSGFVFARGKCDHKQGKQE